MRIASRHAVSLGSLVLAFAHPAGAQPAPTHAIPIHLFAEQTGMALRPYILWRRFGSVWEHRMNGVSLSDAAHAAGFADSAHLARTSRRMIGIPPSAMDISE